MKLRLVVDLEGASAYKQMAIDEAMLILRNDGIIADTLRIYRFKPSAVTIGYFQRLHEVVNIEFARSHGIDVTRRFTGGGAVYHDSEGELTYSIALAIYEPLKDIQKSYEYICRGIVEALNVLDIKAEFRPINDVVVQEKKISGSAQARKQRALLQHGTLMYATNLDILAQVLKPPKEKLISKHIRDIRERITTISIVLGRSISTDEVLKALIHGFRKALNAELYEDTYTEKELRLAEELESKYRDPKWINRR